MRPEDLTPSQRLAYEARDRRVLILGGPGTGKTTVALLMAQRILEEEPVRGIRRILFLTFSRSATTELARRASGVLTGEIGRRIEISTFHSFAMNMLNAFRRFAGGPVEPLTILSREEEKLGLVKAGAVTFDNLVPSALNLLDSAEWLSSEYRRRYAAVICDEFQDTNSSSARLIEKLSPDCQLICLADADQVIFDWTDNTIGQRIEQFLASGARQYDLGYDSRRDPSNVIPRAAAAIRQRDFGNETISEACRDGRLRVVQHDENDDPFDVLVDEARSTLREGSAEIGIFLATNRSVNELAERLRDEDIEHEIIGLSAAAGDAQIAVGACARFTVGEAAWDSFLVALGIFVASCYRGKPPNLALGLAQNPERLEQGLLALLNSERDAFRRLTAAPLQEFLDRIESFWRRLFRGRSRALWELGVRDLRGQTLRIRRSPLDKMAAGIITHVAEARRAAALVDDIPASMASVRLMNVYQVKGREMDDVFLVHLPQDHDEWNPEGMRRLSRVHYVSISRARHRVTLVLPPFPKPFFAPYSDLCQSV